MAEYADYEFYKEKFHGITVPEDAFSNASVQASSYAKYITCGRAKDSFETDYPEYAEDIKLAVCAMAEVFYQESRRKSKHGGLEVASENNDGYSVTYAGVSDNGASLAEKQAKEIVNRYLAHTGLLYRGVYG